MADFDKFTTPSAIAAYYTSSPSNDMPYLTERFFRRDKQAKLTLAWLQEHTDVPMALMPSALDAKATFRDREGFSISETKIPFFREAYHVSETNRRDFEELASEDSPTARAILSHMYNDAANLIRGALVVPERMRTNLMFPVDGEMQIPIDANGVKNVINYDKNHDWKSHNYTALSGTSLWTAPTTADPFTDIANARDIVNRRTGKIANAMMMNTTTFNKLMLMDAIKDRFVTTIGRTIGYLTKKDTIAVVKDVTDLSTIYLYDKQYKDESGVAHKFVPDGYVAIFPDTQLGTTWFSMTNEEFDLRNGKANAEVAVVETGVAITRVFNAHPVTQDIIASVFVLPSFEGRDSLAVLKVTA